MLCTAPDVCPATCLARGYKGDQGVDHQIAVKIILRGIRICSSVMEVVKEFVVKGYADANFDTNPDHSE